MTTNKKCSMCQERKPLSDFYTDNSKKDGCTGRCKVCIKAHQRGRVQRLTEKRRESRREYRKKTRAMANKQRRVWVAANPEKHSATVRRRHLRRLYNLSAEDYDRLFAAQGGKCLICSTPAAEAPKQRLAVDHCHTTGRVRGLLCSWCNTAIGLAHDNHTFLEAAAAYLRARQPEGWRIADTSVEGV